eukprot:gb/GECH01005614.1/.p1 GENE.gb/GECH01005614.1/~~gb/GECH01005614.1/.p1  ORF type:complete len:102 (+),score=13.95 gb/GECH01005614.1/:1-306(+)
MGFSPPGAPDGANGRGAESAFGTAVGVLPGGEQGVCPSGATLRDFPGALPGQLQLYGEAYRRGERPPSVHVPRKCLTKEQPRHRSHAPLPPGSLPSRHGIL